MGCILLLLLGTPVTGQEPATKLFETYCFECHGEGMQEGGFDLQVFLGKETSDATLLFEHLITEKMPPRDAAQPSEKERDQLLRRLAKRQIEAESNAYRRLSRFEFNHSVNDLLGIELDLAETMADDRGTNRFDTDRRIGLTSQRLMAYFTAADQSPAGNLHFPRARVSARIHLEHQPAPGQPSHLQHLHASLPRKGSCFRGPVPIMETATLFSTTISRPQLPAGMS